MDALELARWQFGITTVYHFFFVPITIGLSFLVAIMQTMWMRTRDTDWLRLTKFFGKLFTINFILGLVTGIVQEFQFGMNWSEYSRFVGDIFGAPLAIEALLAFFLESTFLGLWIFGWGRIPEKLHLLSIWLVAIGTWMSAYFILAANSFMQNPVGYKNNPETGRAELTDFVAVLTNKVQLVTFPHVITAAVMTAGAFVMAVGLWKMWRGGQDGLAGELTRMYRRATRLGAIALLIGGVGVIVSGDVQGKIMTEVQPMKMAAAEAHYETGDGCADFSIFTVGSLDGREEKFAVTVPCVTSFLAHSDFNKPVEGINDVEKEYEERFGAEMLTAAEDYTPVIPVTYWSFRLMMGPGLLAMVIALAVLWRTRKSAADKPVTGAIWRWSAIIVTFLPLLANSFGWIFTEMGRQPWLVFGLMSTSSGVSPNVAAWEIALSLGVFTLVYGVLAVVEVGLTIRYIKAGAPEVDQSTIDSLDPKKRDESDKFVFSY